MDIFWVAFFLQEVLGGGMWPSGFQIFICTPVYSSHINTCMAIIDYLRNWLWWFSTTVSGAPKNCLDLMCWRLRAILKNLTLLLHLNVTLLGEKMVHVLYLDHKNKRKSSVETKRALLLFLPIPFFVLGVFNVRPHISWASFQYLTTYLQN